MQALEELTRFWRTCRHILLGPPANPEDQDRDWRAERPSSLTGGLCETKVLKLLGPSPAARSKGSDSAAGRRRFRPSTVTGDKHIERRSAL